MKTVRHLVGAEAAKLLISTTNVRHLYPFMGKETSLAEAAQAIKLSKSHMSYWLNKLLRLELIEQTRIEKRGKHNVPLYQATADVFTVPIESIPVESDEDILEMHTKDFDQIERRSIIRSASTNAEGWHIRFSREDRMLPQMLPSTGEMEMAKILNKWGCLSLTDEQAKNFRGELLEMLKRYAHQETANGKDHLFRFVVVEAWLGA